MTDIEIKTTVLIDSFGEYDDRKSIKIKLNNMGNTLLKLQKKLKDFKGATIIFLISEKSYNILLDYWITRKLQQGVVRGDLYEVDGYVYGGILGNVDIYYSENVDDLRATFDYKYINNKKIEREYEKSI